MNVFVLSQSGQPLMPTKKLGKVRRLLKAGRAKIIGREPLTIQLLYETSEYTQPVTLGVDAGYQIIGYSATTTQEELIGGQIKMLTGISERLKERAMYRRNRRGRKRYRKPRFDNRAKAKGWLAPSVQHKLDAHLKLIERMRSILPITQTIIEVANFDIQAIKNPGIQGIEYQQGEQAGFWNVREYVFHRDHHRCQNPDCKTRAEKQILRTHHIGYWKKDRSDRPGNLITLCTKCHTPRNHQPDRFLHGWKPTLKSFRDSTFMTTIRWRLVNATGAQHTYGYLTKSKRIALGLLKSHHNDAFMIANGQFQARIKPTDFEEIKNHARSRTTFVDAKYIDIRTGEIASGKELYCGRTTRNRNLNGENLRQYRGQKVRKGRMQIRRAAYALRPGDIVTYEGQRYVSGGVHDYGKRTRLKIDGGTTISVPTKKIAIIGKRRGLCIAH